MYVNYSQTTAITLVIGQTKCIAVYGNSYILLYYVTSNYKKMKQISKQKYVRHKLLYHKTDNVLRM